MNEEVKGKKCPQLRFSGFDDDWEEKKLGNVSDRVTRKNENLESTLPLTISAQYGLVDQITFFNNQVASTTNLRNYFLVKNGEFAYNKSYSAGYPWGAIKRLDRYEKGVLSTLYIVFKPKNINSDYLLSYYDTNKWYKQVSEIAAEGARNHGLLNIAPNDFFQTTFIAPLSELEQQKIGTFLSHVDSLIQAKTKKLESLKAVKKSLLQKCFPKAGEKVPEMRFAGFSGDWEEKKLGDVITVNSGKDYKHLDEGNIPVYGTGGYMLSVNAKLSDIDAVGIGRKGTIDNPLYLKAPFWTVDTLFFMTANNGFDLKFIYNLSQNIDWKSMDESTSIPSLSKNNIVDVEVLIPPSLEEQQKIGQFFSKYDSLITAQQKEIDKLKDIKKALLQKMFI